MTSLRCFVALELDDGARRDLDRLIQGLRRSGADVKWVEAGNLHITLEFLGDVPSGQVPDIVRALEIVATTHRVDGAVFEVGLSGIGTFGPAANPRVIWVGPEPGRAEVADLAARVETVLVPLGFPRPGRGFSPHLTLGRCRSAKNLEALGASLRSLAGYRGPKVRAERFLLLSSDLRPTGPVYSPLGAFSLVAGEPQGTGRGKVE